MRFGRPTGLASRGSPITLQQYEAVIRSLRAPGDGTMMPTASDLTMCERCSEAKNKATGQTITSAAFNNTKAAIGSDVRLGAFRAGREGRAHGRHRDAQGRKAARAQPSNHELAAIWNAIGTVEDLAAGDAHAPASGHSAQWPAQLQPLRVEDQRSSGFGSENPRLFRSRSHETQSQPRAAPSARRTPIGSLEARAMKRPTASTCCFQSIGR